MYLIQAISSENNLHIVKEARTDDHREADRIAKSYRVEGFRSRIRYAED